MKFVIAIMFALLLCVCHDCAVGCIFAKCETVMPVTMEAYEGGLRITGCTKDAAIKSVVVPEGVTEIGDYAFSGCDNLESIVIPRTVRRIGDYAFESCIQLKQIEIPDTVLDIGVGAFFGCTDIQTIEMPNTIETIKESTFWECKNLEEISIPDSVREICDFAFLGCEELKKVVIPDKVSRIGCQAFVSCGDLTSIEIPDSVCEIGDGAFSDCKKLERIYLPDCVETIGDGVFSNCDGLISISFPDSVSMMMGNPFVYCDQLKTIELRKTQNTRLKLVNRCLLQVEENSSHLVAYLCSVDANRDIPEGVKTIGKRAFYGLGVTGEIVIPASVEMIYSFAFEMCHLEKLVILSQKTQMDGSALLNCSRLSEIEIPDSLEFSNHLFSGPFESCSMIQTVTLRKTENAILEWTGKYLIQNTPTGQRLVLCRRDATEAVDIPESVTEIGSGAFDSCEKLKQVEIPKQVREISDGTFSNNRSLQSVIIPNSVIRIGRFAFGFCVSLESVSIPESVSEIDMHAFAYCDELKQVIIPDRVKSLYSVFYHCDQLEFISIPDDIEFSEVGCFSLCSSLREIELRRTDETTLTWTGKYLLQHCADGEKLIFCRKDVVDADDIPNSVVEIAGGAFSSCIQMTSVAIPDSVKKIGYNAFGNCVSLVRVEIPTAVTEIENDAFSYCYLLREFMGSEDSKAREMAQEYGVQYTRTDHSIEIGETSDWNGMAEFDDKAIDMSELGENGAYAELMSYCQIIPNVTEESKEVLNLVETPEGLIVEGFTEDHQNDKILVIPQGVTEIRGSAFFKCENLEIAVIPSSVKRVGESAFLSCDNLRKMIILGEGVVIESRALGCESLTDLLLPDNATIEELNLYMSGKLTNIYLEDTGNPTLEWTGKYLLSNIRMGKRLIFCRRDAKSAMDIPDTVTEIGGDAFVRGQIEEVAIPESVSLIGEGAFARCYHLRRIEIPKTVKEIGKGTFYCTALVNATIPEGVTTIGEMAFAFCDDLVNVEIPDSVRRVDSDAFEYCDHLKAFIGSENSMARQLAKKYKVEYTRK